MRRTPILFDTFIKHFPKKYIDKQKKVIPKKVFGNRFGAPEIPVFEDDAIHPDDYIYTRYRPWERQAKTANEDAALFRHESLSHKRGLLEVRQVEKPDVTPIPDEKWFFFRGDRVQVLVGKNKGRQGVVLSIVRERNWIFVEGLHFKYEYLRMRGWTTLPPTLRTVEQPLIVPDEVQLVDPKDMRPTDVEWRWNERGERVRVSLRTGYTIPMPASAVETYDYKTPETYKENVAKDTISENALEQTYQPKLATFEEELSEAYGIVDNRKYKKTYWY